MKKGKSTIPRNIVLFVKPYMGYLIFSLIFAVISVVLTLYAPILTGNAIDFVIKKGKVDFFSIYYILKVLTVVIFTTSCSQWTMNLCNNIITYRVVKDVRTRAFAKLQILPLKYIDSHQHGETMSRIITDVEQFSDGLLFGFTQLFTGVVAIIGTLVFMLAIHVKIAMVVMFITPLSLFVARFIAKRTYTMFKIQSEVRAEMTSLIDEMVGNQKVVQAFGYGGRALERFDELNERLGRVSLKATFFSSITNPATRFVNGLVYTGVGIVGAFTAIGGAITVGQLSCFLSYANQYTKPFNEISGVVTELQNALACTRRVLDFMGETPEPLDIPEALVMRRAEGSLELEDISFSYNKEVPLIRHLSLAVRPGQKIALAGSTGCGKTTLINLLMRFYDVDAGRIVLNSHDIRDITRDSLRGNYGMVLQETWLKSVSVAENIAYGSPDASREDIIGAAKAAQAHSFIMRLEEGYDTLLHEKGNNLSQGQKQLLCIARVMLSLPPMMILDEATSSIDTRTEMKIQEAFQTMMEGRTSFIVAHRLSTIRGADVILVMKNGRIVEQGKHRELLEKGGFYKELYESQFAQ